MTRRTKLLAMAAAVLLVYMVYWSYDSMAAARQAAIVSQRDQAVSLDLAAQIEQLGQSPMRASEGEKQLKAMNELIGDAARQAGVAADNIVRVASEASPRHIGDSVYSEKVTEVAIRRVTLEQLVTMLHALLTKDDSLNAKVIRLSAPRDESEANLWSATVTVSYLIYDPPKAT